MSLALVENPCLQVVDIACMVSIANGHNDAVSGRRLEAFGDRGAHVVPRTGHKGVVVWADLLALLDSEAWHKQPLG